VTLAIHPLLAARGYGLRHHTEVGSTNLEAKAALREGADRLWIVADRQVAGRGRHDRGWQSPIGNLYASLVLAAPAAPPALAQLGFVAGVALVEAIGSLAPDLANRLAIKWPNDLLLDGAKCAGILLEGEIGPDRRPGVVIGWGVNVVSHPADLPRPALHLQAVASWIGRDDLFSALQARMAEALSIFDEGRGFAAIRRQWLASTLPMGQRLSVKLAHQQIEGDFAGLDPDGALLLETGQGLRTILAGDVFLVGESPPT
jgi:BirA family biotin operon repressor/biotin-[acetyl-CoA-carboxylase] ligase